MENMIKICPTCGKTLAANAGFCAGCGTNVQAVAPVPKNAEFEQFKTAATDIANSVVSTVKTATKGAPVIRFIPIVTTILSIICVLAGDWLSVSFWGYSESGNFFETMELFAEIVEGGIIIFIGLLIIGMLLSLAGSVLSLIGKSIGKILPIVGNAVAIFSMVLMFIFIAIEAGGYLDIAPGVGAVFFFIFCIASIVVTIIANPKAKTPNFNNMNQQFNPMQGQAFYPQQNQQFNNYNNNYNNNNFNNQF